MNVTITKHFDYLTPFDEADNDVELATIMRLKYPKACSKLEVDAGFFSHMVEQVKKFSAWRVIGFKSFEDFCREKLGRTLAEVEQIVAGVRVLQSTGATNITTKEALAAAPKRNKRGRPKNGNNAGQSNIIPNTKEDWMARLKRDHPDICKRVAAGEFKSIRAAAIAAGIVKVKTPGQQLLYWAGKVNKAERPELLKALSRMWKYED